MKSFKTFRLDTAKPLLWRNGDRVPVAPKGFDVLAYLVEHAGRVVTQEEILEALWPDTHGSPEVLRKYILEIRRALGDRPNNPEFIETLPKRGYQFIAAVTDESTAERPDGLTSHATEEQGTHATEEQGTEKEDGTAIAPSKRESLSDKRGLGKLALVPVLLLVLLAAVMVVYHLVRQKRRNSVPVASTASIAVLPFADMSPAKNQEFFSDGLTEQLIDDLARVSGLKVIGRSSAFQFKGNSEDVRAVGRTLGVANVLEGSVRREGNHVRITAELIKADDGFQLWSQTYDREIKDIFAVQDEIARAATEALQPK